MCLIEAAGRTCRGSWCIHIALQCYSTDDGHQNTEQSALVHLAVAEHTGDSGATQNCSRVKPWRATTHGHPLWPIPPCLAGKSLVGSPAPLRPQARPPRHPPTHVPARMHANMTSSTVQLKQA